MLKTSTIEGERIAALFPIIGGDESGWTYVEGLVVTTNENGRFTFHRVNKSGLVVHTYESFSSLPAAVRAARQAAGWG